MVYFDRYESREIGQGFETEPTERRRGQDTQWVYYPTDVTQQGHRLTSSHRGCIAPTRPPAPTTLLEFVAALSKPRRRLLAGLNIVHDDAVYWIRHQWENKGLLI